MLSCAGFGSTSPFAQQVPVASTYYKPVLHQFKLLLPEDIVMLYISPFIADFTEYFASFLLLLFFQNHYRNICLLDGWMDGWTDKMET